jgi:hypothetical protein
VIRGCVWGGGVPLYSIFKLNLQRRSQCVHYSVEAGVSNEKAGDGAMKIGRGNQSSRRKPSLLPHGPLDIPHYWGSNTDRQDGKLLTSDVS